MQISKDKHASMDFTGSEKPSLRRIWNFCSRSSDLSIIKLFMTLFTCTFILSCSSSSEDRNTHPEDTEATAELADGTYKASYGHNYLPEDEQKILAITATLDRVGQKLVFTTQDGAQMILVFTPRDTSQWRGDCYTMDSHVLDEIADLTPAPLQLESMTFNTPVVYAKCSSKRMILTTNLEEESSSPWLVFDLSD
jgi:hypothetical protein